MPVTFPGADESQDDTVSPSCLPGPFPLSPPALVLTGEGAKPLCVSLLSPCLVTQLPAGTDRGNPASLTTGATRQQSSC